ncbi:hypothetical protein [Streptomyces sp. NPDC050504]|uniref:hypothetical protein n=1 Tax=Streptomyces sp. NPDC050504 TaxID=3365618 RepID=UPI00379D50A9
MPRFRTRLAVALLAAAGSLGFASPALAHCPDPAPLLLSDENFVRFVQESPEEQRLILENAEYRAVWLECPRPDHVEKNMWGPGYICLPEGVVQ